MSDYRIGAASFGSARRYQAGRRATHRWMPRACLIFDQAAGASVLHGPATDGAILAGARVVAPPAVPGAVLALDAIKLSRRKC